jgi:hypothetical protein
MMGRAVTSGLGLVVLCPTMGNRLFDTDDVSDAYGELSHCDIILSPHRMYVVRWCIEACLHCALCIVHLLYVVLLDSC